MSKSVTELPVTPVIGVLYSPTSEDENERNYGRMFTDEAFSKALYGDKTLGEILGCRFVPIDYSVLCKINDPKSELLALVKRNNLCGFVSPGNYYNVVSPQQNPSRNRETIEAIMRVVATEQGIPELLICGGEQRRGYEEIKSEARSDDSSIIINDVHKLTGTDHKPENGARNIVHGIILKGLASTLHGLASWKGRIKSEKKPSSAVSDIQYPEMSVRVNSVHTQSLLHTPENAEAMKAKFLDITATDETGKTAEVFESSHGRFVIATQFHPEYFALGREQATNASSKEDIAGMEVMRKVMLAFVGACKAYSAKKSTLEQFRFKELQKIRRISAQSNSDRTGVSIS